MKRVIVLTNNENRKSIFLQDFEQSKSKLKLKLKFEFELKFEIFSLWNTDKKLNDYIGIMDGIIIVVDDVIMGNISPRIEKIVKNNPNTPMIFVLEVISQRGFPKLQEVVGKLCNEHRRLYIIPGARSLGSATTDASTWFGQLVMNAIPQNPSTSTSTTIDASDMANHFQNCTLRLELWDHYARLKIIHYALTKFGLENTAKPNSWLCTHWKKYEMSIGHGNLWHYTLVRFWVLIIDNLRKNHYQSFDELYQNNPIIHNDLLYKKYYSDDVILNPRSRIVWFAPNLR